MSFLNTRSFLGGSSEGTGWERSPYTHKAVGRRLDFENKHAESKHAVDMCKKDFSACLAAGLH